MVSGGKLSRRTQIISAIGVVLVFGGGWLVEGALSSVWVSAEDDRDCVIFYFRAKKPWSALADVLASISFSGGGVSRPAEGDRASDRRPRDGLAIQTLVHFEKNREKRLAHPTHTHRPGAVLLTVALVRKPQGASPSPIPVVRLRRLGR